MTNVQETIRSSLKYKFNKQISINNLGNQDFYIFYEELDIYFEKTPTFCRKFGKA